MLSLTSFMKAAFSRTCCHWQVAVAGSVLTVAALQAAAAILSYDKEPCQAISSAVSLELARVTGYLLPVVLLLACSHHSKRLTHHQPEPRLSDTTTGLL
jgi:hypothetical protein